MKLISKLFILVFLNSSFSFAQSIQQEKMAQLDFMVGEWVEHPRPMQMEN